MVTLRAHTNKDEVDVRAYGALGDGATDDTTALAAALTAGSGRTVVLPPGTYMVTSLNLDGLNRTRIVGASGKAVDAGGVIIKYTGAAGGTFVSCRNVRELVVEGIAFVDSARPGTIVNIDQTSATTTDIRFRHCVFEYGGAFNSGTYGVKISETSSVNVENIVFESCDFVVHGYACVRINSANAKAIVFRDCTMRGTSAAGASGTIGLDCNQGSFEWDGGLISPIGTAFRINVMSGPCRIAPFSVEQYYQFLSFPSGGYSDQLIVERVELSAPEADPGVNGIFNCEGLLNLHLRGVLIGYDATGTWKTFGNVSTTGTNITAIGCTFPNASPGWPEKRTNLYCTYFTSGTARSNFNDRVEGFEIARRKLRRAIVAVAGTAATGSATDDLVTINSASGSSSYELPAADATMVGMGITVVRLDSSGNTAAVGTNGTDTVNGVNGDTYLTAQYEARTFRCVAAGAWVTEETPAWDAANGRLPAARTPTTPTCDTIAERTADAGVTIDGVLVKDGGATIADTVGLKWSDVQLKRGGTTTIYVRNAADSAYAGLAASSFGVTSAVNAGGGTSPTFQARDSANALVNVAQLVQGGAAGVGWLDLLRARVPVVSKTTTYTATDADEVILCSASGGAWTLTLPAASGRAGKRYVVQKTDSSGNAVTIDGNAAETINGAATLALSEQYATAVLFCDGTGWSSFVMPAATTTVRGTVLKSADVNALTISGTLPAADESVEDMPAVQATPTGMVTGERDAIRRNFADLATQINDLRAALRNAGIMA